MRRAEYRMKIREGANSAFSGEPRLSKSESCMEMLNFMASFQTFMVLWCAGKTSKSGRSTVKSFAVLSVRERSSGNSEAKIAHNSRLNKAIPSDLTIMLLRHIVRQPISRFILLGRLEGKIYKLVTSIHSKMPGYRILPGTEPSNRLFDKSM